MATPLGEYLRSRRALVDPTDLGLPRQGARRVPGLRREEVATLTGMSADYYIRLEQGRETSPSAQILDAIGRTLRLDDDARLHLWRLAGLSPRRALGPERTAPALQRMLDQWPATPALVLGRAFDVLASNTLADALFTGFSFSRNLLETLFLQPSARSFYPDWEIVASATVDGLRLAEGAAPQDPRLREVVAGLLATSPDFDRMWQRNDPRGQRLESKRFIHPRIGPLTLHVQAFDVRASPGQELVVYSAEPEPDTANVQALNRLAALPAAPPFTAQS